MISFRYDHLAFIITHAIQNREMNMNNLVENLNQTVSYSILQSDLRPADNNTDLAIVKIQAQLLKV